eukprot:11177308-Lingulodinium_polyedra.AAC.1
MECAGRAICEPLWQQTVDSSASLCSVLQTRHDSTERQQLPFAWSARACDYARSARIVVHSFRNGAQGCDRTR